jgi:hypothetical protein
MVRYVDIAAEKLTKTVSWKKFTTTENGPSGKPQRKVVVVGKSPKNVARQRKLRKLVSW